VCVMLRPALSSSTRRAFSVASTVRHENPLVRLNDIFYAIIIVTMARRVCLVAQRYRRGQVRR
jgi:hypothetical protein